MIFYFDRVCAKTGQEYLVFAKPGGTEDMRNAYAHSPCSISPHVESTHARTDTKIKYFMVFSNFRHCRKISFQWLRILLNFTETLNLAPCGVQEK
jgi:hypothetical protein